MILEGLVNGVRSIVAEVTGGKASSTKRRPAHGILIGTPVDAEPVPYAEPRPSREQPLREREREPRAHRDQGAVPSSDGSAFENWPIVMSLAHAFDHARHRLFGSNASLPAELRAEPWVMHYEKSNATPHPATYRAACGLCISYERLGRNPIGTEMIAPCPACGQGRGHARDCSGVQADFSISDASDWQTLPGQLEWDDWSRGNAERGGFSQ